MRRSGKFLSILTLLTLACTGQPPVDDGPVAAGVSAPLGEPLPTATAEQLATFERGRQVLLKRFDLADGLGPTFNLTFCGGCHEKPVSGGSAGLYRNFFLGGRLTSDGAFIATESNGAAGGVLRMFHYGDDGPARPVVPATTTILAQRNAIPTFGMGLLAELDEAEILSRVDVNDADGDGISGRPNFDRGFVGRFGRKAQTVSIEGFIRGPLMNHLGITTDPLSELQRIELPVDSSRMAAGATGQVGPQSVTGIRDPHQAAAPDGPLTDADLVQDPELSPAELFDLVSFTMLLAAPELDPATPETLRGRAHFQEAGCAACHVPRLEGPRGPLPVFSDLLLHDMGAELADGIIMGEATGSEFRTQPLWGLAATGPYLHDGRAHTISEAILAHGGEAQRSRDAFAAFTSQQQAELVTYLMSLGGAAQATPGLMAVEAEVPAVGAYGGPRAELTADELARFVRGRAVYDRDFGFSEGTGALAGSDGAPRFNGDSCRACHFDPVLGGAGPRGVNVMRHGHRDAGGAFTAPSDTPNTILHKQTAIGATIVEPESGTNVFEFRQTPHTFGLGLIDAITPETIAAHADPDDTDGNGISGRVHLLPDGRTGRLGWKADVPSVAEFVRDAMAAEIGLTIAAQDGLTFGITTDGDAVADPELTLTEAEDLAFFLTRLGPPPRQTGGDATRIAAGEALFGTLGCVACHIPSLPSALGDVPLYSDLLLHHILAAGEPGVPSGDAGADEFRTAPLWGLSQTAPYFHNGAADTIDAAIRMHAAEGTSARIAYEALSAAQRDELLAFLGSL